MEKLILRRKFIGALGGVVVTLGAALVLWQVGIPLPSNGDTDPQNGDTPPENGDTPPENGDTPPNGDTDPQNGEEPSQNGPSVVSIVKGQPDTNLEALVRRAVDDIGGIEKIVAIGNTVVIKPAVLTSTADCAPNPLIVAAVAKLVVEAGGYPIVAESSGNSNTTFNLSEVGITSAAQAAGAEVRSLPSENEVEIDVPGGVSLHRVKTYSTIRDCDVLISVPKLKRHASTNVTISLKNMMGTIPQSEMGRFHQTNLSQCIADLNTVFKPHLTVVDATYAMARTGPTNGEMVEMDTVLASVDPVAIDRIAAQRLQDLEESMGIPSFNAANVKHINNAAALGVGTNDLNEITVIESNIS